MPAKEFDLTDPEHQDFEHGYRMFENQDTNKNLLRSEDIFKRESNYRIEDPYTEPHINQLKIFTSHDSVLVTRKLMNNR